MELANREADFRQAEVSQAIWEALDAYRKQAGRQERGTLACERNIVVFLGKKVHILRPAILANWTRTAALNDAANLYAEIVAAGKARV